ncbi:MAG: DUF1749 domain-containing protein [Firmicutes bacterium]|nr:DUF1749 domain-containing protein [Bacillota bacterium]
MKSGLARFKTSDGLKLQGLLYEPENKTDKIVIHVHGAAGNFYENKFIDDFSVAFTKAGYAFLAFNNRGSGYETEMVREQDEVKDYPVIGMLNEIFEECVLDIEAAIAFAKNMGYNEIVLQGHSLGCNKVIWPATQKNFAGKIILLAPCDLVRHNDKPSVDSVEKARELVAAGKLLEKVPYFWGNWWNASANTLVSVWGGGTNADMFSYRNGRLVPALADLKNPILVLIGTDDNCYDNKDKKPVIKYLQTAFASADLSLSLIESANHWYSGKEEKVSENIVNWLNKF